MKIAVKVGGSVSMDGSGPRYEFFSKLVPVLEEIDEENELSVGIGGGDLVRSYGSSLEKFDLNEEQKEECFIKLIDANVMLLSFLLEKEPLESFDGYNGGEVVVGGIEPGRSTDANSALVAEEMGADLFIILTDVDGIYDRNPEKFEGAERIREVSFGDVDKLAKKDTGPADYGVVDPAALEVIARSGIETYVLDGKKPDNISRVLRGKDLGTHITD